ncbi:MAG: DHA2 family efflux MFS transporter permease subunit [Hyphomicrobiales bacterium]
MSQKISRTEVITIVTVISAAVLEIIDATIVNIAIPDLMGNLGATITEVGWVITSYAAANIVMIALSAWMSSKLGRRRYFVLSIGIFTVGSLFCGFSTSIWELVFFRFIQGMGGGALLATAQAIIVETFPKNRLNFANAIFGMGIVLGPAIGPVLGGYILQSISWNWIFFINIPLGFAATVLAYVFIKEPKEVSETGKMDWIGLFLLVVGLGSLLTFLENGQDAGWFDATYIRWLAATTILGSVLFVIRQTRAKYPIVHFRVLKNLYFSFGLLINMLVAMGMAATFLILPLFAQNLLKMDSFQTGLLILPGVIIIIIVLPLVGRLPQKKNQLVLYMTVGFILMIIYNVWVAGYNDKAGKMDFLQPVLVRGVALSLLYTSLATLTLIELKGKLIAEGTGLFNLIRKVGNSVGVAITVTFISRRIDLYEKLINDEVHSTSTTVLATLNKFESFYFLTGMSAQEAAASATEIIAMSVTQQAFLLTYLDTFRLTATFFAICIPVIFILYILRKIKKNYVPPV